MRTPDEQREYMKLYMRRYRASEIPKRTPVCLICGKAVEGAQMFYCGPRCRKWASNARHRTKYRDRLVAKSRVYREANPDKVHAAGASWRARHRQYYKRPCPECDGMMNRTAARCDRCRLKFESACVGNPACAVVGAHKHCRMCGEPIPMRRRWDEWCRLCEADRVRLGLTEAEFRATDRSQEELEEAA
jgi:predicted nucleic acid-binding Zn ribbon protein